jgi:hypothetical protein
MLAVRDWSWAASIGLRGLGHGREPRDRLSAPGDAIESPASTRSTSSLKWVFAICQIDRVHMPLLTIYMVI